uniref:Ribbon-helix-helix protein CopG domain-containing protein n=1 Tax=uncultured prokaryote TaxID=198431 RepID=A0A0H5Q8T6_9ZZZZ|nr:hypothetical protein [uncultured prokaryote]
MPTATINFSDELYFKLGSVVKQTGMSRSAFVNKALENYLQELQEDSEDYERAEKAWNDYVASGEKTYTLDEVKKELDI